MFDFSFGELAVIGTVALVVLGVATFGAGFGVARLAQGDSMSPEDRALLNKVAGYSPADRTQQATYLPRPVLPVDLATRPTPEATPTVLTPVKPKARRESIDRLK